MVDFIKVNKMWHRYCWIVCLSLLGYSAVKTFSPNVKVIEKTKTIVDTAEVENAQNEIKTLNDTIVSMTKKMEQLKKENKNIQEKTTIVEITRPDGTIEKKTEKTYTDTSETNTTSTTDVVDKSTSTTTTTDTSTVDTTTKTKSDTDVVAENEKNPIPFWATIGGYQYKDEQYLIGHGINIGQHITTGVLASYTAVNRDKENRWDGGLFFMVRY